jgi:hypothetical protein
MEREDGVSLCARYTSPFDRLTVLSVAEGRTTSDEEENRLSAVVVPAFVNHAD